MMKNACFHCGESIPENFHASILWQNQQRPLCCYGCKAVAELILENNLEDFYKLREGNSIKPQALIPAELEQLNSYNNIQINQDLIDPNQEVQDINLYVEGISCAACSWLIEKNLMALTYIQEVNVNIINHVVKIKWLASVDNSHLGDILKALHQCGYKASPLLPEQLASKQKAEQKVLLKRLGVATIAMMQVMMFSFGLYTGIFNASEQKYHDLLIWVSWMLTTPVVFYSAAPFFKGAYHNMRHFTLGMNVPIALAISAAYFSSSLSIFIHKDVVYFDSVVMLVFFLLLGRFLQARANWRAIQTNLTDAKHLPLSIRVKQEDKWIYQPLSKIQIDDIILLPAGETLAVDGVVITGESQISTSIINGEFQPIQVAPNHKLVSGCINQTHPLEIKVSAIGENRFIEQMAIKQQQALAKRPESVDLADKISQWFVLALLIVTSFTALYWYITDPDKAFSIIFSLLVVTCPCALSLATPVVVTAAIAKGSRLGFLIMNSKIIHQFFKCDWIVFDKTGTLTQGKLSVIEIKNLTKDYSLKKLLDIANALEMGSDHPISKVIQQKTQDYYQSNKTESMTPYRLTNRVNHPLQGISAEIDGDTFSLGIFSEEQLEEAQQCIYLYKNERALAKIILMDPWRADAQKTLSRLKDCGFKIALLTGDSTVLKENLTDFFTFDFIGTRFSPDDKLNWLQEKQISQTVAMVGDGFNDSLVLAGADVSVAMTDGASLSRNASDAIMLTSGLTPLLDLVQLSQKTQKIIQQNLTWAVIYNASTIPLAAMGVITPWMAAIGMSISSLLVVLNALRINPK